jgi:tRNA modification GTPase
MNTIVALATSHGRSAIGVVRLSGPEARSIVQHLVDGPYAPEPGRALLQSIKDPHTQDTIDQALITYFKAPHSFTGEDVIEISCHGSPVILRQVIDHALHLGARLAEPGEFSLRALTNGKINLSQAEAIRDLIEARTTNAARQAARQLSGELSQTLTPIKQALLDVIVLLESALEFAEDDLPALQTERIVEQLTRLGADLNRLASTFSVGHLLAEGLRVAIIGRPNVGKSSVFNSLLATDRSIVTDIPGTTRDSISEQTGIEGIPILLTDTAGVRQASDSIERLGIARTERAMVDADLLLLVIDGSEPLSPEDKSLLDQTTDSRRVVALNKSDLPSFSSSLFIGCDAKSVEVSARTGAGLDKLRAAILEPFGSMDAEGTGLLITNARHHDLLRRAESEVISSIALVEEHASEELSLVGLHNALRLLDEITGETTAEDILSQIFATFCIGK